MVLVAVHCGAIREDRRAVVVVLVMGVMNARKVRSSCGEGECILNTLLEYFDSSQLPGYEQKKE